MLNAVQSLLRFFHSALIEAFVFSALLLKQVSGKSNKS